MKAIYSVSLSVITVTMFILSVPVYASKIDDRVELSAKQSYLFKTYLQGDDIKIESMDGAVTLTGTVSEEFHKSLANETVTGLPGVKSVDNRLEVKDAPSTANSDAWLRDKIKFTLLFHRSVSADTTKIDVKDGVVTLKGDATSQAQKDLTTEYTKDIEGVKDVNNLIIVSQTSTRKPETTLGEDIDDASITAQIKITLLFHRSTSAMNTKVETNNGNVTMYGKASNTAEKDLVTKRVNDINGVKSVNNRMTIE